MHGDANTVGFGGITCPTQKLQVGNRVVTRPADWADVIYFRGREFLWRFPKGGGMGHVCSQHEESYETVVCKLHKHRPASEVTPHKIS